MIGISAVELHQGQRPYAAPKGRTYDRTPTNPFKTPKRPCQRGPSTYDGGAHGSGMKSFSSPGTMAKRACFQSSLAASMRSFDEDTKFHQM